MGDSTKSGSKYKRPMEAATNKVIHRVLSLMSASEISMPGSCSFLVDETQGPIPDSRKHREIVDLEDGR